MCVDVAQSYYVVVFVVGIVVGAKSLCRLADKLYRLNATVSPFLEKVRTNHIFNLISVTI